MLTLLLSLYTVFFEIGMGDDHLYIYNALNEGEVDVLTFKEEHLQESFFCSSDGDGQFAFSTYAEDTLIYYLYSIPLKELTKLYTLYMEKQKPYFIFGQDMKIVPMGEGALINDTLLLVGGRLYKESNNYIIYINPSKKEIIKVVPAPEAKTGPDLRVYSKKNGLLAFGVYGLGRSAMRGKVCLLNVETGKVKEISEGFIYPKTWLDDSLLLILDEGDYIIRQRHYELGDTIHYSSDLLTYNIYKNEMTKIADDTQGRYAYKHGRDIYFVEIEKDYDNKTTNIIVKDSEDKVIKRGNIPQFTYRTPYFIPYPEDTIPDP